MIIQTLSPVRLPQRIWSYNAEIKIKISSALEISEKSLQKQKPLADK